MKEFVVIFRHAKESYTPTGEEMKGRMEWLGGIAARDKLADKGRTLIVKNARTIKPDGVVKDAPYTGSGGDFVSGFMIVKAETVDEAAELVKGNPIFAMGGSVELREAIVPGAALAVVS
jgi:hypothetical protein